MLLAPSLLVSPQEVPRKDRHRPPVMVLLIQTPLDPELIHERPEQVGGGCEVEEGGDQLSVIG